MEAEAHGSSGATSANAAAYDAYVHGKVIVSSENPDDNESAIKLFQQAVTSDPNFAGAYAELARAYSIKARFFAPVAEKKKLNEEAEVDVEKALALDPNLAEGYFARGLILWTPYKRFPHEQAVQSYKRALELNPNLDEAHHHWDLSTSTLACSTRDGRRLKKHWLSILATAWHDTAWASSICAGGSTKKLCRSSTAPRWKRAHRFSHFIHPLPYFV